MEYIFVTKKDFKDAVQLITDVIEDEAIVLTIWKKKKEKYDYAIGCSCSESQKAKVISTLDKKRIKVGSSKK